MKQGRFELQLFDLQYFMIVAEKFLCEGTIEPFEAHE